MAVWSLALGLGAAAEAAAPVERLAPADSVVVISVDDFAEALGRFKETRLWALWRSDEIQGLYGDAAEEALDEVREALEELEIDEDALTPPSGPVGVAIFPGDLQGAEPGFIATADFGEEADQIDRIVKTLMDKARDDLDARFDEQEVLGRTVYTLDVTEIDFDEGEADQWKQGRDEPPLTPMGPGDMPEPREVLERVGAIHFVRDGSSFMVSSDFRALRDALETSDEDGRSGLDERADFRAARSLIGRADGYAIVLTRDIADAFGGGDPMAHMAQQMVQSIVGDIKALSFGVRLGGAEAMVEETLAVYMPNGKNGLSSLLDNATPRSDVPSFVSPRAIGYTSVNFEFDGVIGLLRTIGQTNPMLGAEIDQFLFDHGDTVRKVCSALGPDVHTVTMLARPLKMDSLKTLYVIRSSNPGQVEEVLAEYAPQLGLQPRDFLGHRIYDMPANPLMMGMGAMVPGMEGFAIGFGGGWVMAGNTSVVEDGLRAAGDGQAPTIAGEPVYKRALRVLAGRPVAWGVANIIDHMEYFIALDEMVQEQMIEQWRQWDPEYARELERELAAQPDAPWADLDPEMLRKYLGPISWDVRAVDEGFVCTSYLFGAGGEEADDARD